MAAALDVREKQGMLEFLCCDNETLKIVHGDATVDRSQVSRWARRLSGESGHADYPVKLGTQIIR
jgi:hypothetical protein